MASGLVLCRIQRPDTWQLRQAMCKKVDKTLAKPEPSTHGAKGGLPPEITASSSDGAVLFQMGDRPISGEAEEDHALLPLYHALGRKLAPLKDGGPSKEHPRSPIFGWPDESLLWERRLYDGR